MIYSIISNNLPFDKYLSHLLLTGDNDLTTVYSVNEDFLKLPTSIDDSILTLKTVDLRAFSSFYQHKLNLECTALRENIDTVNDLVYFTKHLSKNIIHCGLTDFLVSQYYLPISECVMLYVKYDFDAINTEYFFGSLTEKDHEDFMKTSDIIDNIRSEYRIAGKNVVTIKYDQLINQSFNLHNINLNLNTNIDRKLLLYKYLT
jgi:hypothetical protein